MIGKMYEARKNTEAFKGNQYTLKRGDGQNVQNQTRREIKDGTSGEIGKDISSGQNVHLKKTGEKREMEQLRKSHNKHNALFCF